MRRLPPLNQIRAFEAVARNNSFSKAACELCVTPGALTRHVKALEEYLGNQLLTRTAKGAVVNSSAAGFYKDCKQAFDILDNGLRDFQRTSTDLRLKVVNSFAIRWFLGEIQSLQDHDIGVEIRLSISSNDLVDFDQNEFDGAIIYASQPPEGYTYIKLFSDQICPVCRPELLSNGQTMSPEQLVTTRLLASSKSANEWQRWFDFVSEDVEKLEIAMTFDLDDLAIQAAVAGHGVALANLLYVINELTTGTLVFACDLPPATLGAHYFIYDKSNFDKAKIAKFCGWLESTAQAANLKINGFLPESN